MAKVKISKKSTRIDMTAMCDVAFLLLTFFILTATAKQPEPKVVDTPASTVQTKLPEEGVATITVGDKEIFFNIPRNLRKMTLERVATEKGLSFSDEEYNTFVNMDGFGVPFSQLNGLLKLETAERNEPGRQAGIPIDSTNDQLTVWIKQAREANRQLLTDRLNNGEDVELKDIDIAIKGDADEDYPTVKRIIDILQDQKKNRFFLVTALRDENF